MAQQPVWYRDTEKWLLAHRGWLTVGLVVIFVVTAYLAYDLWVYKKGAVKTAAWLTYLFMP